MDFISACGGSPAGRQPAIRGISSSYRARKHTHTHTEQTPTWRQLEWKVLSVATNGQCFSSPNSPDAPSAARHLLSFTFRLAAAAPALCSPLVSSALLSFPLLSSPLLSFPSVCVWLTLSASSSPLSPLSTSLTHCLSLPLITFLSGARGFLISDITAAVQRRSRFTRRSGLTAESSFVPVKCLPSSLPLCSSWAKETFFFFFLTHLPVAISPP